MFGWSVPPRVIGHRGAPHAATENTLASFRAAQADGARAVELDVRLAVDGVLVVHHDAELGRVIPGAGRIEDLPSDALRGMGIPPLSEILAFPFLVDVEIKADADNAGDIPGKVLELAKRSGALDRVLVTSFDHELADEYARLSKRPAGAIVPYAPDPDELAAFPRLSFIALAEDAALPEVLDALAKAERATLVWTVDDADRARGLLAEGAAGIITDRPGPLARSLEEAAPAP